MRQRIRRDFGRRAIQSGLTSGLHNLGAEHRFYSDALRVRTRLFSAKNFPSDVRPEFLEDVIQDSGFHLRSPVPGRLTQAALLRRIIGVGQASFQSIAHYLGPVKARASRICLSEEGTGYRVTRSAKKPSLTHGVIAWVLV